ncbi:uncharacterized protein C2845_PM06G33400 [Panicum miliaceum]|uniref:Uncharacterized protein n=1 Tax=Panicum miliaceum TaxID=4540 RepID=A0A3L6R789_PANMI|nr:uncharacterized protein C2845_PM06G33400 [Panicum miliaceum]
MLSAPERQNVREILSFLGATATGRCRSRSIGGSGGGGAAAALELEAPFKGGCAELHMALHTAATSVEVRARGGRELQACVVPHHGSPGGGGRGQEAVRAARYVLGFVVRLESECLVFILQGNQALPALHRCSEAQPCPFSLTF